MEYLLRYFATFFSIILALWSAFKSVRNLIKLYSNSVIGIGKDFDVYHSPILIMHVSWVADFIFASLSVLRRTGQQEVCSVSAALFSHFLSGLCRLQIALNWAEIAGMNYRPEPHLFTNKIWSFCDFDMWLSHETTLR